METICAGKISGNGIFSKKCHDCFIQKYGFPKVLLTTSRTHALEMGAFLIGLKPGDEVIILSYMGKGILSVFHYLSMLKSPFYHGKHVERQLPNCDMYSNCLLRLPHYYELEESEVQMICDEIYTFFGIR